MSACIFTVYLTVCEVVLNYRKLQYAAHVSNCLTYSVQLVMWHQNWDSFSFLVTWVIVNGVATKRTLSDCSFSKHGTLKYTYDRYGHQ